MFNNLEAPITGVVKETKFGEGESVGKGDILLVIGPKE
jgi:biotin carboxyl carrier protein